MGIIKVETPQGVIDIEIEGDQPTSQEMQDINVQFFGSPQPQPQPSKEIDLATASIDEIKNYVRLKRAQGIDPATGQPLTEQQFLETYKEPGVDYTTGVDNVEGFSRFMFGSLETKEEKKGYLDKIIGKESYREDAIGRLILNQEGRSKLGLGPGEDVAFDEEGLTTGDIKDFIGAEGVPILSAVGASLMTTGVGFVPGIALVAGAGALGKAADEAVEYLRGFQKQSLKDVALASAMEGVFSLGGDIVGRGIAKAAGRAIKGPVTEAAEAQRAAGRGLLDRDLRPTIGGATSEGFRPILNRIQAIYEGVFPNEKAAKQNLGILLKELQETSNVTKVTNQQINDLGKAAREKIEEQYAKDSNFLAGMQKQVDKEIEDEIGALIAPLQKGLTPTKDIFEKVRLAQVKFDENIDRLYTRANKNLKGARFVSVAGIREAFDEAVQKDISYGRALKDHPINDFISEIEQKGAATIEEVTRLKQEFYKMARKPELFTPIAGIDPSLLRLIGLAASNAVKDMEGTLAKLVEIDKYPDWVAGPGGLAPSPEKKQLIKALNLSVDEESLDILSGLDKKVLAENLGLLRRTGDLNSQGKARFDNSVVQSLMNEARLKNGQLDTRFVYNSLIKDGDARTVDMLMKAVRGMPETPIVDLGESQKALAKTKIDGRNYQDVLDEVQFLPIDDQYRKRIEKEAARITQEQLEKDISLGKGAELAETLRQQLLSQFIKDSVKTSKRISNTGVEVIDGARLAGQLTSKGAAIDRLLGPQKKEFNDMVDALARSNVDVAPEVLEGITKGDLLSSIRGIKNLEKTQKIMSRDTIRKKLASGDLNQITDTLLKDAGAAEVAKDLLGDEVFEQAKDASMARIIQQIGGTVTKDGKIELSGNFFEDFTSGRLGKKLNTLLSKTYGQEHIDNLFGKDTYRSLMTISEDMISASNAAIAGKGGLAAPAVAASLGFMAFLTGPLTAGVTTASYLIASRSLRNPTVLKAMMSSRKKNKVSELFAGKLKSDDPIGQGVQTALQIANAAIAVPIRYTANQGTEELAPSVEAARQEAQARAQQAQTQLPTPQQILPAVQSGLQNLNPFQTQDTQQQGVSPILVPNPATRAAVGSQ